MKWVYEETHEKARGGRYAAKSCPTDALAMPDWYNPKRWTGDLRTIAPRTYFVGWKGGPVKIGRAVDPARRISEIQVSCPYRIHLWAISNYPVHEEPRLHGRFRKHRMWGEWFAWHPDLEAMMASLNGARKDVLNAIRGKSDAE